MESFVYFCKIVELCCLTTKIRNKVNMTDAFVAKVIGAKLILRDNKDKEFIYTYS
jgi:hypothetical protein